MEFMFDTAYDQKALTAMARTLRKTLRKKRSCRSHIFGGAVVIAGLLLSLPWESGAFSPEPKTILTWLVILLMIAVFIWEDRINGYFAGRKILPGTGRASSVFQADSYHSTTEIGETAFRYESIKLIAETPDYFVFVFSKSHAQIYDKRSISGGTTEDFRKFIEERTGMHMVSVN